MGSLDDDVEVNTVLPIYSIEKRIEIKEGKEEVITERVVTEQVDAEGFLVQGDRSPFSEDYLFVGTSPVRTEKKNWQEHYKHCKSKNYREFWFCKDSFKNRVIIYLQKQILFFILGMLFTSPFVILIGNLELTMTALGVSGLILLIWLTHLDTVVDVVMPYPPRFVEVHKNQNLVRFVYLEDIVPAKAYKEDIHKGKIGEKQILIAKDVRTCYADYTEKADILIEEIERKDILIAAQDKLIRDIGIRYEDISEEEKEPKVPEEIP